MFHGVNEHYLEKLLGHKKQVTSEILDQWSIN
jgi:hypothetical protein